MKPTSYNLFDMLFLRYPQLAGCRAQIFDTTDCLIRCYRSGGKLLICGNGGSASDAAHIVGELMKSFILSRPVEESFRQKLLETDPEVDAYARELDGTRLTVLLNWTDRTVACPLADEPLGSELISNYPTHQAGKLQPYEARVFLNEA